MRAKQQRMCVACRRKGDQTTFLRVVCAADGRMAVDPGPNLQGRSAYLCRNINCFELARKNRSLQRSLKRPVPDIILQQLKDKINMEITEWREPI